MGWLWIPITVVAALLQTVRTALQKRLTSDFSATEATFARFVFAAPLAALLAVALVAGGAAAGRPPALTVSTGFFVHAVVGGAAQVAATILLVKGFAGGFAFATAWSKTETVQTAIFAAVLLGEPVGPPGAAAIGISLVGVVLLSTGSGGVRPLDLIVALGRPAALIGLASGGLFGLSAVSYRAAALALGDDPALTRAVVTLAVVTAVQTAGMVALMGWLVPGGAVRVRRAWRRTAPVALTSLVGSVCWFTAMTLQNAAYVRALGQVELIFTVLVARRLFREPLSAGELAGIGLIALGVVLIVVFRPT